MKKRMISLALAIALMSAMCISASAISTSGYTQGGAKPYLVTATLVGSKTLASATTETDSTRTSIHYTVVTYTYYNRNGQVSYASVNGNRNATVYPDVQNSTSGICAESQHAVNGGETEGSWSGYLYIPV